MGARGKAPAPTNLKLIRGDRPSRINYNEPKPREALPEPPESLAPDVLDVWHYTIGELKAMGTVTAADRDSLIAYCEAVVNHRKASDLLAKTAIIAKGRHGFPVKNPALQVQRDNALLIRLFAQEFGLTPSGRTRIEVAQRNLNADVEDNPFAGSG